MSRDLGARGIFHRPLEGLRWPAMMIFPFFTISTWYMVNITTQSSSQSCLMEIMDPDLRSLNMCPTCASWESLVEGGLLLESKA